MADPNLLAVDQHPNDVEAVLIRRSAVTIDPDVGGLGQLFLFPPVNSGHRPAEVRSFPSFDLDERHCPILLDHEVDISTPVPKASVYYPPTVPPEPPLRDSLTQHPECLLGRGHGGQV